MSAAPITPATFNDYNTELQGTALKATRSALALPADISFYRSIDHDFARELDKCSARVLSITNKLLDLASTNNASGNTRGKGKARLEVLDDVVDNFHTLVVDVMDQLLERADAGLDEFQGRIKPAAIAVNPAKSTTHHKAAKKLVAQTGRLDPALTHASHLPKPQLIFKRKVDNSHHTAWTPSLKHKYNAQVPLGYSFKEGDDGDEDSSTGLHPYRYEVKHISYPSRMFVQAPPMSPQSFEDTPFTWVATKDAFAAMLDKLRQASEIAVDLEYHNYRSFGGFVCLMQISTRLEDFVVDTFAVREELEELNEVFTDPQIIKVFHGAESDIVWLQQDFNLYVVNLFDTYHASKVLDFPRHGLATLLEMYCDFTADKRYQLADWRIRPLPDEMLQYARSDTHFLLFIYDNLRNALLDRAQSARSRSQSPASVSALAGSSVPPAHALIREVLARSEETALRVYEKETYDFERGSGPGGWDTLARKWNKSALGCSTHSSDGDRAANVQREVYRCVHAWRDRVSREEDESTRYVLPNHYLFSLAERTPADMAALLAVFHPVPPVIKRRARELLDAIRDTVKRVLTPEGGAMVAASSRSEAVVDQTMLVDAPKVEPHSQDPSKVLAPSLWSKVPTIAAPTSSLFGTSFASRQPAVKATRSSLFGGSAEIKRKPLTAMNRDRFIETATRIHQTLVIAPSAPKVSSSADVKDPTPGEAAPAPDTEEAEEIPFVPASQRVKKETVDDTIVVVGQAKRKKRKRDKGEKKADVPQVAGGEDAQGGEFDYASVSNILDDGVEEEDDRTKIKKKRVKGASFFGDFPAPPKAHSELKSGNQSRTFR